MICKECKEQAHSTCTNNQRPNSCDCQHRLTDDPVYAATLRERDRLASTMQEYATELVIDAIKGKHLLGDWPPDDTPSE